MSMLFGNAKKIPDDGGFLKAMIVSFQVSELTEGGLSVSAAVSSEAVQVPEDRATVEEAVERWKEGAWFETTGPVISGQRNQSGKMWQFRR